LHTNRQTDRQEGIGRDRQPLKAPASETHIQRSRHTGRQTQKQTERQTGIHIHKQPHTNRQADR